MIEYASHRDLHDVYLLYSMQCVEKGEPLDVVLVRESVAKKKINVHIVRLPFIFEEDLEKTKQMLKKTLINLFLLNS